MLGTHYSGSLLRAFSSPEALEECGQHHGIFLMNHHYEVDWMFGWMMAEVNGTLANGKVIAKKVLKYVPTLGWAWALTDTIFLERDWQKDQQILKDGMNALASYAQPVWLLLYPEGTRMSKKKLQEGQEFAKQRGLPVYKHHLVPRTKGFALIMSTMDRDKFKYIYDVTLAVNKDKGAEPNIASLLMAKSIVADAYIRQIPISEVPKDPELASQFLFDLFKDKDLLMESYFKSGGQSFTSHIPKDQKDKFQEFDPVYIRPRVWPLVNSVVLNMVVSIPILNKLGIMVSSGSMFQLSLATLMVVVVYFSLKKFIGITKIKDA